MTITTGILDSFNTGASQAVIGGTRTGWHATKLYTGEANYTTDATPTKAVGVAATFTDAVWGTSFNADQEIYMQWAGTPTNVYLHARIAGLGAPTQGYYLQWLTTGSVQIKLVSGSILATFTQVPASNDAIGFTLNSTTLEAWYKASGGSWASVGSVVDGTWTGAGFIGWESVGGDLDEVGGGNVVVAAAGVRQLALTGAGA